MNFKEKMKELDFTERRFAMNKDYPREFFTFSKQAALSALSYLIDNATKSIDIYHKSIEKEIEDNRKNNAVLLSLRNNKSAKVRYYTSFSNVNKKNDYIKIIKDYVGEKTEIIDLGIGDNVTYHHKEMLIDNKYLIVTSWNFLTNAVTRDSNFSNKKVVWLENFSIWVRRSGK